MKHIETSWKLNDGIEIFAQGWEPEKQQRKAVVCLVHGVGEHTSRYEHVARIFTKSGYVLFGADLRGHGRSKGKRGHFPSAETILNDIDIFIEKARTRYPGLPLFLYGHSLGGILVLYYSLKRHPKVKGVISSSPGLRTEIENQKLKVVAAKLLGTLFPKLTLSSGLDSGTICRDEKVVDNYKKDSLVHDKISLGFGKVMLGVNKWTLEHAVEFPLSLLLMHGKKDTIAFVSGSKDFAERAGEKSNLVLWENAWHELHNEPEKNEVFETMLNWLNKKLAMN